jgi:S1-C subfamily serine protease/thiol-disulfide isomerase/thioredoxin
MDVRTNSFCVAAAVAAIIGAFCVGESAAGQEEIGPLILADRQWSFKTDQGVAKLDARLIGLKQGTLEFEDKQGRKRSVALADLAPEDQRAALIQCVGSGVVVIETKNVYGEPFQFGSGFVLNSTGLILTNYHVVAGAASVSVTFRDHEAAAAAEVLSVDRARDVAFLRVQPLPTGVHVVELNSRELPAQGSTVWSIGHPGGLKNTVGWGNVSAIRNMSELPAAIRQRRSAPADSQWLQTNAVIAQGSSGGPLLNEFGQAVGVNTFLVGPQLGFALHISEARQAYLEARTAAPKKLPFPPAEEEDAMAWISAEVAPIVKAFADEYSQLEGAARSLTPQDAANRLHAINEKYRGRFLDFAKAAPQGWPAVQALTYSAQLCEGDPNAAAVQEICRLALEHHLASRHISSVAGAMAKQPSEPAREFCRRVAETSPHEAVRFTARFSLGVNLLQWLVAPDSLDLSRIQGNRGEIQKVIAAIDGAAKESTIEGFGAASQAAVSLLREQLDAIRIGLAAPEIVGVDIQGAQFRLSDYRGKVVLLDFFVNWCPYCRQMYPSERAMVERWKDRPFALLGVHCESQQVLDKLVNDKTVTWRSWADGPQGPIAQQWDISSWPSIVLIDRAGLIRWRSSGVPSEQELVKHIEQLLAEPEETGAERNNGVSTLGVRTHTIENPGTKAAAVESGATNP